MAVRRGCGNNIGDFLLIPVTGKLMNRARDRIFGEKSRLMGWIGYEVG